MELPPTIEKRLHLHLRSEGDQTDCRLLKTISCAQTDSDSPEKGRYLIRTLELKTQTVICNHKSTVPFNFGNSIAHQLLSLEHLATTENNQIATFGEVKLRDEKSHEDKISVFDQRECDALQISSPVSVNPSDTELSESVGMYGQQPFGTLMSPFMSPNLARPSSRLARSRPLQASNNQFTSPPIAPTLAYLVEPDSGSSIPRASRTNPEGFQAQSQPTAHGEHILHMDGRHINPADPGGLANHEEGLYDRETPQSPISIFGLLPPNTDPNTPDFGSRQPSTSLVSMGRNPIIIKTIQMACSGESTLGFAVRSPELDLLDQSPSRKPKTKTHIKSSHPIGCAEGNQLKVNETRSSLQKISLRVDPRPGYNQADLSAPVRPEIKFNYQIGGIPSPQKYSGTSYTEIAPQSANQGPVSSRKASRTKKSISNVPVCHSKITPEAISGISDMSGITQDVSVVRIDLPQNRQQKCKHQSMKLIKESAGGKAGNPKEKSQRVVSTSTPEVSQACDTTRPAPRRIESGAGGKHPPKINVVVTVATTTPGVLTAPNTFKLAVLLALPALLLLVELIKDLGWT